VGLHRNKTIPGKRTAGGSAFIQSRESKETAQSTQQRRIIKETQVKPRGTCITGSSLRGVRLGSRTPLAGSRTCGNSGQLPVWKSSKALKEDRDCGLRFGSNEFRLRERNVVGTRALLKVIRTGTQGLLDQSHEEPKTRRGHASEQQKGGNA